MGFMVPVMLLIIINTAIILLGLKRVYKKQTESLRTKLQEIQDRHEDNIRKATQATQSDENKAGMTTLENLFIASTSRNDKDSSETLDREELSCEETCYVNVDVTNEGSNEGNNEGNNDDENEVSVAIIIVNFFNKVQCCHF